MDKEYGITKHLDDYKVKPFEEACSLDDREHLLSFYSQRMAMATAQLLPIVHFSTFYETDGDSEEVKDILKEMLQAALNIADLFKLELPDPEQMKESLTYLSEAVMMDMYLAVTKTLSDIYDLNDLAWVDLNGDVGLLTEEDLTDFENTVVEAFFNIHLLALQFEITL